VQVFGRKCQEKRILERVIGYSDVVMPQDNVFILLILASRAKRWLLIYLHNITVVYSRKNTGRSSGKPSMTGCAVPNMLPMVTITKAPKCDGKASG